jgi:hypothetical protein
MHLNHNGLGESHTMKFPCEGINFGGVGILLSTMLLTLPFSSGKLLKKVPLARAFMYSLASCDNPQ